MKKPKEIPAPEEIPEPKNPHKALDDLIRRAKEKGAFVEEIKIIKPQT